MSDSLDNRLRRSLDGRPLTSEERRWADSWRALSAALGRFPAVDAEALAGDVLLRIAADRQRRRRRTWVGGGMATAVAATMLAALWVRPAPAAANLAWEDRLDPVVEQAEWLLADANRPATPVAAPNLAARTLARATELAEQWERETL